MALLKAVWWGMRLASLLTHLLCLLFNYCMIFMAALCSRCGHYIFACDFFFYLLSFFPCLISWSQSGCLPYFHTWCGLSENLRCRSETCCTRLAGNTGCKNDAKNHHLGRSAQLCRALSSQLRHVLTIRKKLVKQQYLLHMSS